MIGYFNPRTLYAGRPREEQAWLWAMLDVIWMALATVVVGITSFALGFWLAPVILLAITAGAVLAHNTRRNRAMIAVNYLEQAIRLNLPLPAMLRAAEQAERGALRRRLGRMSDAIEGGTPIGYALHLALPGAPERVVGLIACGERLGQLPGVLQRIVRRQRPQRKPAQTIVLRWYPVVMLMAITAIGGGVSIFAFPKLQSIFSDFHLQLPAITRIMLAILNTVEVPLLIVSAAIVMIFCGRMLSDVLPRRRPARRPWVALTDRIAWYTPVWRRLVRGRGLADLCYVLGEAIETGQPLDRALAEAAEACGNRVLSNQVLRWSEKLTAGAPLAQAAREARMPRLMSGMLATTRDTNVMQNVFGFLTRYYDRRFSATASFIEGAALPIMVAILGLFVASLALGVFVPMVQLANHLSTPRGLL